MKLIRSPVEYGVQQKARPVRRIWLDVTGNDFGWHFQAVVQAVIWQECFQCIIV